MIQWCWFQICQSLAVSLCLNIFFYRLAMFSGWQETILSFFYWRIKIVFYIFLDNIYFLSMSFRKQLAIFFGEERQLFYFISIFFINECRYFYFIFNDFFPSIYIFLTKSVNIYGFAVFIWSDYTRGMWIIIIVTRSMEFSNKIQKLTIVRFAEYSVAKSLIS